MDKKTLKLELQTLDPPKVTNWNDFVSSATKYLEKYKNAGGNLLEDSSWVMHSNSIYADKSTRVCDVDKYDLYKNEIVFDNSVELRYQHCVKTLKYVKNMVALLSKLTDKVKVTYKYVPDEKYKICWIIIKCRDKF